MSSTSPQGRAAQPVCRPTGTAARSLQGIYGDENATARADLRQRVGLAVLRLQAHRVCTSVVSEFDHALRAYVDAEEVTA